MYIKVEDSFTGRSFHWIIVPRFIQQVPLSTNLCNMLCRYSKLFCRSVFSSFCRCARYCIKKSSSPNNAFFAGGSFRLGSTSIFSSGTCPRFVTERSGYRKKVTKYSRMASFIHKYRKFSNKQRSAPRQRSRAFKRYMTSDNPIYIGSM